MLKKFVKLHEFMNNDVFADFFQATNFAQKLVKLYLYEFLNTTFSQKFSLSRIWSKLVKLHEFLNHDIFADFFEFKNYAPKNLSNFRGIFTIQKVCQILAK